MFYQVRQNTEAHLLNVECDILSSETALSQDAVRICAETTKPLDVLGQDVSRSVKRLSWQKGSGGDYFLMCRVIEYFVIC